MRDDVKNILHDTFQWLVVLSVPFIMCFYWPNHEPRLMKFICFQTYTTILLCVSFIFAQKRVIDNPYPALFLLLGFINLFTHGMNDFVNVGVGFILPTVIGIYVLSNHLLVDFVPVVKKTVVITCLINCVLFVTETLNLSVVFIHHPEGYFRPSGFMCYPSSFALLCAVSLFLAWDWQKWLVIPIGACFLMSHEYAVMFGFLLAVSIVYWKAWWKILLGIAILTIIFSYFHFQQADILGNIKGKLAMRLKYLYPVIQNVWARPLDGWGAGMYNRLPDSFFGFFRGNWSEMHCEPLDLFFSFGFMGLVVVGGWIYKVRDMFSRYKAIFITYGVTSCFHSTLHFADTIWLFVVLYALYEIEKEECLTP